MNANQDPAAALHRFLGQVRAAMGGAVVSIGHVAVDTAKGVVPVRTGALRDTIQATPSNTSDSVGVTVAAGSADVTYAGYVEAGTERMQAQPFMRPARDRAIEVAPRMAKEAMKGLT